MATGAGKTVTAITATYRLLRYGRMNRILFLVDTKSLGEQAEMAFTNQKLDNSGKMFRDVYSVQRLKDSFIPENAQVCISTIQRMYSILKGESGNDESLEASENRSSYSLTKKELERQIEVSYSKKYPPEFFDCIIVDECHRSIYKTWKQVLNYFDSFVIGLTATPDSRAFNYFNQNVVSRYDREHAIIDGVNVGEDVFLIETEIGVHGAKLSPQTLEARDRRSRKVYEITIDDDFEYTPSSLDHHVFSESHIRIIIQTFKENLFSALFPGRKEVPKTLIFAKSDSHADDIIRIVREEFGERNEFCQKITCSQRGAEKILNSFRNDYFLRIAVTVDMISTGVDVKPLECLIFMRNVKSQIYFEQMKGRGTRTLKREDLMRVSPSATEAKDRFVVVDAVGVTKTHKWSVTRTLERHPHKSFTELMKDVTGGIRDEETLSSLANRIVRLNSKLVDEEQEKVKEEVGLGLSDIAHNLLDAYKEEVIAQRAGIDLDEDRILSDEEREKMKEVQVKMIEEAIKPFFDPGIRDFLERLRLNHDQIIDDVNIDSVLYLGWSPEGVENARRILESFKKIIEDKGSELDFIRERPLSFEKLKAFYEAIQTINITIARLWESYRLLDEDRVDKLDDIKLADLIQIIKFEKGLIPRLVPFAQLVGSNFREWVSSKSALLTTRGDEKMLWFQMLRDRIATSLSVKAKDLYSSPFSKEGGLGKYYDLFGDDYEVLLAELNSELVK
ncbi:type III restriction protein res subunit [Candidatus Mycoplasma haematolamae str. Purdue]|uniref:Type III restriction protein res subunit n=1 Tax=Mycoplasma haematolamae (strain Purdue) TaxID=1212765 RepID=I7BJX0_MYCHA|nr:DEAD/DEAH box helicase family protein [Candidatus Mycoplasma haematolamae]AFO52163.1 type III restriction protein res subunit [Candidatus Mycoplasma haematolamae str. Purdue]